MQHSNGDPSLRRKSCLITSCVGSRPVSESRASAGRRAEPHHSHPFPWMAAPTQLALPAAMCAAAARLLLDGWSMLAKGAA